MTHYINGLTQVLLRKAALIHARSIAFEAFTHDYYTNQEYNRLIAFNYVKFLTALYTEHKKLTILR